MWKVASICSSPETGLLFVGTSLSPMFHQRSLASGVPPLWAKNIIPSVAWIDGDIYSPAPSLLKLGYHRSVDVHYLLPTTRELPKCSALGYGLDQVRILLINKSQCPYTPISLSIVLLCFVITFSHGPLIPLYYYPTPHFLFQVSHPTLPHSLSSFPSSRSFPFE